MVEGIFRIRLVFSKTDAMRFTSHLDLHRTWERVFRRAGLPLAYSQGFNPRPRLNLASALPLGFTSQNDILDAWFEREIAPAEILCALQNALPPGIGVCQIEIIDPGEPKLQTRLIAAEYIITFVTAVTDLDNRYQSLLDAADLPRQRRGKQYDLRPLIVNMRLLEADEMGRQRLWVSLVAKEGATGRPEEILSSLGIPLSDTRIHRVGLVFQELGSMVKS
jgi:radical SAM-linked protein